MSQHTLHLGDCLEVMRGMADNSVDAVVTDPPYGLSFMGKKWDHNVPSVEVWAECLRVLKPGGHLLAFAGTRTQHRMAVNIEDAGFEIRDMIAWVYGSGFPKSADVSKMLDKNEQKLWLDMCKAIDNADKSAILEAWKEYSKTASNAGLSFRKSKTATGTNMQKSGSVPASVLLQANLKSSDAIALVAELSLTEARPMRAGSCSSVQSLVESNTTESKSPATNAESRPANHEATLAMPDSSALQSAWGWQGESTGDRLKAVGALKTWLGKKKSSNKADTDVLCAALTADLKHIILSRSETYRNADTIRQTDFASAINVTTTESTAASLISFMAATLRSKAIDKAAGVEREVVGNRIRRGDSKAYIHRHPEEHIFGCKETDDKYRKVTAPATPAARQWQGWGTSLKPALEPITVARKPLDGTVAANVLEHGTGALNVDGCRVGTDETLGRAKSGWGNAAVGATNYGNFNSIGITKEGGRWPANLITDGSDEVVGLFPQTGPAKAAMRGDRAGVNTSFGGADGLRGHDDAGGSAARFFYTAKAAPAERQGVTHPTVKPLDLMAYLCRLVTPPGGIVLDPFMGTGTTVKAAISEGFHAIGIERDPDYFAMAEHRLDGAQLGLPLVMGE